MGSVDDETDAHHQFLLGGAKFALGPGGSQEDAVDLLIKTIPVDKAGQKLQSVSYLATQAQGRAQENIRNKCVQAFDAACASSCPLNPSSRAADPEVTSFAKRLFQSGDHKTSPEYDDVWLSACHAALREAYSVAKTSRKKLLAFKGEHGEGGSGELDEDDTDAVLDLVEDLPVIPSAPSSGRDFKISIYALGFVVMKVRPPLGFPIL